MELLNFVLVSWLTAMLTTFTLLFLRKIGFVERMQVHGNRFVSQLFQCAFCLSFWLSLIVSIILVLITNELTYIFIPFFSTPLSRHVL